MFDIADQFPIGTKVKLRPDLGDYLQIRSDYLTDILEIKATVGTVTYITSDRRYYEVDFGQRSRLRLYVWLPEHLVLATTTNKPTLHHNCPKCGDEGEWRMCALVCRHGHGIFAG
jgi:hypothetical protein